MRNECCLNPEDQAVLLLENVLEAIMNKECCVFPDRLFVLLEQILEVLSRPRELPVRVAKAVLLEGNGVMSLPATPGMRVFNLTLSDQGGGQVYFTLDGSDPNNDSPRHTTPSATRLFAGPLEEGVWSQLRFVGSAGSSRYTLSWEEG